MKTAIIIHNLTTGNIWTEDEAGNGLIDHYFKSLEAARAWCEKNSMDSMVEVRELGKFTRQDEIKAQLENHIGKRVSLTCQVGVCIWGEMFTLENGHGLCLFDCVRDGMRIGIGIHSISKTNHNLDGTLSITIS